MSCVNSEVWILIERLYQFGCPETRLGVFTSQERAIAAAREWGKNRGDEDPIMSYYLDTIQFDFEELNSILVIEKCELDKLEEVE